MTIRSRRSAAAAGLAAAAFLLSGCGLSSGGPTPAADTTAVTGTIGDVTVASAFVTSPGGRGYVDGGTATAQFTLSDGGTVWDTLTSVSTPAAGTVRMQLFGRDEDEISVPTGGGQEDATVQLLGLTDALTPGQRVALTFQFTGAGSLTLDVPVH
jgi:copper(I)-binding protein